MTSSWSFIRQLFNTGIYYLPSEYSVVHCTVLSTVQGCPLYSVVHCGVSLLLITSSGEQNTKLRISYWNSLLLIIIFRHLVSLFNSYVQSLRTLECRHLLRVSMVCVRPGLFVVTFTTHTCFSVYTVTDQRGILY